MLLVTSFKNYFFIFRADFFADTYRLSAAIQASRPWQFLYFLPLPHGQRSFRRGFTAAFLACATPSS